jgi:hypothetical protein
MLNKNTYLNILESDAPDKHFEYFWLTFKLGICSMLTESEQIELNNLSIKLNNLKLLEKYDEIEIFINKYIVSFGWRVISQNSTNYAYYLELNMKRWKKISERASLTLSNDFYALFMIFVSIHKKNKAMKGYDDIINLISKYHSSFDKKVILKKIVLISIDNNYLGNIDKLRKIYNFGELFSELPNYLNEMSSKKLVCLYKSQESM